MPPMPAEAEALPDLATPLTAMPPVLAARAMVSKLRDARQVRIDQIEIGKIMRQLASRGEAGIY